MTFYVLQKTVWVRSDPLPWVGVRLKLSAKIVDIIWGIIIPQTGFINIDFLWYATYWWSRSRDLMFSPWSLVLGVLWPLTWSLFSRGLQQWGYFEDTLVRFHEPQILDNLVLRGMIAFVTKCRDSDITRLWLKHCKQIIHSFIHSYTIKCNVFY